MVEIVLLALEAVLLLFFICWLVKKFSQRTGSSQHVSPANHVQYVAIPLLIEWLTPDNQAEFEQIVTFFRGGEVLIGNQVFKRQEEVDVTIQGAKFTRQQGSDCLFLLSSSVPRERYFFCYKYFFLRGYAWVNLVRRVN